ncbi:histidine--tRNA ligase [Stenoxybacter acetivorans]|uniref:histidine--tRNA ligase n=1 Tax=Stenoxybacter acetivorans TaxID=422441 RepID=UPI0005667C3E|nr:histidine--tRNA ligase [Stenoxybacter acetivorans]
MGQKIQAVKGMNDLLPVAQKDFKLTADIWQAFEDAITAWARRFAYRQIRTPIVEQTGLFVRSIGEETDVVGKEMYTFSDSNDALSLSLRPEGTASCLRAVVEHNLLYNGPQKLWYMGPMFRRERPQKGRYRQFHQVGVEALGFDSVDADAEVIAMCADLWQQLGIGEHLALELNCLGNREERAAHRAALVVYLQQNEAILDDDSRRRMHTNPLRVLDTKNPVLQDMVNAAPKLIDYLGETSQSNYTELKSLLAALDIEYTENPRLVRGLDYYNHTVFEWTTDKLGAQATVCGGGRYDGLVEELGGKSTGCVGFAMGVERLLLLVQEYGCLKSEAAPDVYLMRQGNGSTAVAMQLSEQLRRVGLSVYQHCGTQSLKAQMKKADASGARFAAIIGDDELTNNTITLKDLTGQLGQHTMPQSDAVHLLQQWKTTNGCE